MTQLAPAPSLAPSTASIRSRIAPLVAQLNAHPIYASIQTIAQLRLFMQSHVFAVWDFMSLLKSLQRTLTCIDVPWVPTASAASRRFINEIVLGEESDIYEGRPISHFELYLEAMHQAGADTRIIRQVVEEARNGLPERSEPTIPAAARTFVQTTFRVIHHGSPAAQAAVFAFGREDAIPEMFRAFVGNLSSQMHGDLDILLWYLQRHIEIDGDDHGPLSLGMVTDLCGDDPDLWEEATQAAEEALRARIALWDGVLAQIQTA